MREWHAETYGDRIAEVYDEHLTVGTGAELSRDLDASRVMVDQLRAKPGGKFVLEAFVPDLSRFNRGQRVEARCTRSCCGTPGRPNWT